MCDHVTKAEPYYPFVVSIGTTTWRLVDMRDGHTIEERDRMSPNRFDRDVAYYELECVAKVLFEDYLNA